MKTTKKMLGMVLVALMSFSLAACNPDVDPILPGNVTVTVQGGGNATVGCTLIAAYDGPETVTFQWNRNGTAQGGKTGTTLVTETPGTYTVTASADGFQSKESSSVAVSSDDLTEFTVTSANFDSTLRSIRDIPGEYIVTLTDNLTDYAGISMETEGVTITIRGTGSNKIVGKSSLGDDFLFRLDGAYLILENIELSRSTGSGQYNYIIGVESGTVEMKAGVTVNGNGYYYQGIILMGGKFIMSGGKFMNCRDVIGITNTASVTISGGEIRDNSGGAIVFWEAVGCDLTISGGSITNNESGIALWENSLNCTISLSGGEISNNGWAAIALGVEITGCTITMSGGSIRNNGGSGVIFLGDTGVNNCNFIMSGGSIGGNGEWGLLLPENLPTCGFSKTGGIIYSNNAGANSNSEGAILVQTSTDNELQLYRTAEASEEFAAKLNAGGTDFVAGSVKGNWDWRWP